MLLLVYVYRLPNMKIFTCAIVDTLRVKRTLPLFLLALKLSLDDTWVNSSSRLLVRLYQSSVLWSLISYNERETVMS